MTTKILYLFLLVSFYSTAQVGIGTTDPKAVLDIKSTNQASPSSTDGILVPKIDTFPATNPGIDQQGMLVYLTTIIGTNQPGFYYWDNVTTTWLPIKGSDTGTLDQAYDFGGAGNGRTITADSGAVLINGTDGLVSSGTVGFGVLAPTGMGPMMYWNPRKAAFRAGITLANEWENNNTGLRSTAFGTNTMARGTGSMAFGEATLADGELSTSFGKNNLANGILATAFGTFTTASGNMATAFGTSTVASNFETTAFGAGTSATGLQATAFGSLTIASGTRSTAFGSQNTAFSFSETVMGIGATTYTPSANGATQFRTANETDRLFVIGNAIDANNNGSVDVTERSDAMVVLKNGNTGIGSSTPQDRLHVEGNIRMVDGNQAAGRVLASDANGTASWQDASANAWGLNGNSGTNPSTNFIGTTDNIDFVIKTNNTEKFRIKSDGRLEVGNNGINHSYLTATSPLSPKLILATESVDNNVYFQTANNSIDGVSLYFAKSRGNNALPSRAQDTDQIGRIFFHGYTGTQFAGAAEITSRIDGPTATNSMPGLLQFSTTQVGRVVPVPRMTIRQYGFVGIGTEDPTARLHIEGNIRIVDGSQGAGRVLTSNATGTASWQDASANAWGLLGNVGTNTATNFIGTSDNQSFAFRTNNLERMRITNGGNLGIGTTTPARRLHVFNGDSGGTANGSAGILLESNTDVYQHFLSPSADEKGILFGSEAASIQGGIIFNNTNATNGLLFRTGGNTNRMVITDTGDVGITTLTPSQRFNVGVGNIAVTQGDIYLGVANGVFNAGGGLMTSTINYIGDNFVVPAVVNGDEDLYIGGSLELSGNGFKPGGGVWVAPSDRRLKQNILPYTDGLESLLRINPVSYKYNSTYKTLDTGETYIGVIAQEVQEIAPYMVDEKPFGQIVEEDENGHERIVQQGTPYLTFDSSALTYMLINSVKEINEDKEQLKRENSILKQELESQKVTLQTIIQRLEALENNKFKN